MMNLIRPIHRVNKAKCSIKTKPLRNAVGNTINADHITDATKQTNLHNTQKSNTQKSNTQKSNTITKRLPDITNLLPAKAQAAAETVFIYINAHLLVVFYVPALICFLYVALYYFWSDISSLIIQLNISQLCSHTPALHKNSFIIVEQYINCVHSLPNYSNSPANLLSKHADCQLLLAKLKR